MKDVVVKGSVYVEQRSSQTDRALRGFRSLSEIDAEPDSGSMPPASC